MTKNPWIPAPCKTTGKRMSKEIVAARYRRRSVPFEKVGVIHDEGPGDVGKNGNHGIISKLNGKDDEVAQLNIAERDLDLLVHLRHVKALYFEATTTTEALEREVKLLKSELRNARMELDAEKEARINAEISAQKLAMSIRESERVIDAQRNCVSALRSIQNLAIGDSTTLMRPHRDPVTVNGYCDTGFSKYQQELVHKNVIPAVSTVEAGVQTSAILDHKTVQTKAHIDRYVQTTYSGRRVEKLERHRNAGGWKAVGQEEHENRKDPEPTVSNDHDPHPPKSVGFTSTAGSSVASQDREKGTSVSGENLVDIMATLETLEKHLRASKEQLLQEKATNHVLRQYIRLLVEVYLRLFT